MTQATETKATETTSTTKDTKQKGTKGRKPETTEQKAPEQKNPMEVFVIFMRQLSVEEAMMHFVKKGSWLRRENPDMEKINHAELILKKSKEALAAIQTIDAAKLTLITDSFTHLTLSNDLAVLASAHDKKESNTERLEKLESLFVQVYGITVTEFYSFFEKTLQRTSFI